MDRKNLRYFFDCGDNEIVEFALHRARLNRLEKEVIRLMMDECMTQEQTAEMMALSTRTVQDVWKSAADKLLRIAWVSAYTRELML